MFWKTKPATEEPSKIRGERLPKPQDMSQLLVNCLMKKMKQKPEWLWTLKFVARPRSDGKNRFDFRVFDEKQLPRAKVIVNDYNSLNDHPELILYEGWFDKSSGQVQIEDKSRKEPA